MNEKKMIVLVAFLLVIFFSLLTYVSETSDKIFRDISTNHKIHIKSTLVAEVTAADFEKIDESPKRTIEERVSFLLTEATTGEDFRKLYLIVSDAKRYDLCNIILKTWDETILKRAENIEDIEKLLGLAIEAHASGKANEYILKKTRNKKLEGELEKLERERADSK